MEVDVMVQELNPIILEAEIEQPLTTIVLLLVQHGFPFPAIG
jgi:hypothetical protein